MSGSTTLPRAEVGVIGGSGLYQLVDGGTSIEVSTPYGRPSEAVTVGEVHGRTVAFLPRHGADHRFPPHRINYRANLWALRTLGVRQVLAPCAVGSLTPVLAPGTLVLPDQLVDRTSGRSASYFDDGAVHVSFADPYCANGRATVAAAARSLGLEPVVGATMVVVQGPRFSTRAESQWYARQGWQLINMTGHPEAVLARELELCYTPVALVTDLDAGLDAAGAVSHAEVLRIFGKNVERLREVLYQSVPTLPDPAGCACGRGHEGVPLPIALP
ncbi:S-methyl-5'-thioadenosine phosphorylase [Micromonospora sp. WMMD1155]|uniref:S-methyl-5'-thioadenosine phosphorylase n=1 Tax=Micromonospora sp. WMMD1155 TaxID=3016094 RepID=UPI00249C8AF5|nr:S-methyl-5'-thioadenosine phosphorylase [Micromonospora sp. WMMD1155]WFE53242.1 S-methyl-5'-thioadenosine phosphorylase [Micromonospora sp. WMMD1155]